MIHQLQQKPMASTREYRPAPEWEIEFWLNTDEAIRLEDLRGKVVVLHAFQMLCPGAEIATLISESA